MNANTLNRVVLLSLVLVLMASFPKSNAFNDNQFGLGNSGGTRFSYFQQFRTNVRKLLPPPPPSPPTPSSSPPITTPSSPPPTPPTSSPSSKTCPPTAASCNFPACAAIPGCQQCQGGPNGNGIICIRCCQGFALRVGGQFCDRCANEVANCATCDPIGNGLATPRIQCTACCHGFGLNFQGVPVMSPNTPRCDPCSIINACTSCIDAFPTSFLATPAVAADLTCTTCAAGFTLNQGNIPPTCDT